MRLSSALEATTAAGADKVMVAVLEPVRDDEIVKTEEELDGFQNSVCHPTVYVHCIAIRDQGSYSYAAYPLAPGIPRCWGSLTAP